MELLGKIALVTGGGRGIGRACALALARAGADVIVAGRTLNQLEATAAEITAMGRRSLAVTIDVADAASIAAGFARAQQELGSCDILINNAGIAASSPLVRWSDELWQQIFDINVTGVFRCMKAALPAMLEKKWGRVINIASIAGKAGAPYISGYAASKHAVLGLTKAAALEVAEKGITINALCPGYVETDMGEQAISIIIAKTKLDRATARGMLENMTPQKRLFQPEEVAHFTVALASPAAGGINGQAINICGGALPF